MAKSQYGAVIPLEERWTPAATVDSLQRRGLLSRAWLGLGGRWPS